MLLISAQYGSGFAAAAAAILWLAASRVKVPTSLRGINARADGSVEIDGLEEMRLGLMRQSRLNAWGAGAGSAAAALQVLATYLQP